MTLTNYQFQFGSFVFGAGTPYQIYSVDGLEGLPELRVQDDNRGYNDGMFSGRDFLAGRTITMEILTLAGNGHSAPYNFDLLQSALLPQSQGLTALTFLLSASATQMTMNVRVRSRKTVVDPDYTFGYIRSQVQFFAPDPRYYSDPATSLTLTPTASLGRTYPLTFNRVYNKASVAQSQAVTNAGNWYTAPAISIVGPCTNPIIGNVTTGQYITINIALANTDTLTVDLNARTVTLTNASVTNSPRRNQVASGSQWFSFAANSTQYLFFGASNISVGLTQATTSYRSAYI